MSKYEGVEVGGIYETLQGGKLEVLAVHDYYHVDFRFLDTGYKGTTQIGAIRKGQVKNWGNSIKEKLGQSFPSTNSGLFTVVEYVNFRNVRVIFDVTKTEVWTTAQRIEKGLVWDPLARNIAFGAGYIGTGIYSSKSNTKAYDKWIHMLLRSRSNKELDACYHNTTVHEDWRSFQNFAEWAEQQVGFNSDDCELDKDILVQGNKEYGPDTCCFVPARINNLTTSGYLGGSVDKWGNWSFALCKLNEKITMRFKTQQEGHAWYKQAKEAYVKEVADEYKNVLDSRVYDALYSWQVN